MNVQYVDKHLESNLPQANLFNFRISRFWFRQFWKWVRRYENEYGYIAPFPRMYFKSRGANFISYYFGPFNLTHRARWLKLSAFVLHKK